MITSGEEEMNIPEPHFDQYQLVILHWNGQQHPTQIVKRIYDPDKDEWMYEMRGVKGLYSADVIDFKTEKQEVEL